MIKMAQLEDIRKMYFIEGLSIREISRRTGIHRDTISKYRMTKERKHPVLDPYICKGKEKATAELRLSFLAYNLKRAINMVGIEKLIASM